MTSGLPDFYSPISVGLQALAEIITRNTFGAGASADLGTTINAGVEKTIANLSAKGVIYGGQLWVDVKDAAQQKGDYIEITVDGTVIFSMSWEEMNDANFTKAGIQCGFLTRYDAVNHKMAMAFSFGITFESTATLVYKNNGAQNVDSEGQFIYATV